MATLTDEQIWRNVKNGFQQNPELKKYMTHEYQPGFFTSGQYDNMKDSIIRQIRENMTAYNSAHTPMFTKEKLDMINRYWSEGNAMIAESDWYQVAINPLKYAKTGKDIPIGITYEFMNEAAIRDDFRKYAIIDDLKRGLTRNPGLQKYVYKGYSKDQFNSADYSTEQLNLIVQDIIHNEFAEHKKDGKDFTKEDSPDYIMAGIGLVFGFMIVRQLF